MGTAIRRTMDDDIGERSSPVAQEPGGRYDPEMEPATHLPRLGSVWVYNYTSPDDVDCKHCLMEGAVCIVSKHCTGLACVYPIARSRCPDQGDFATVNHRFGVRDFLQLFQPCTDRSFLLLAALIHPGDVE